jgi:effector-binding domain-containing protein
MPADTIPVPKFVLEAKVIDSMNVLVIGDTVSSVTDIGYRINRFYADLFEFIAYSKLKPGRTMAFYLTDKPPFVYEAGVEVDRIPARLDKGMRPKKVPGGNAIVAHYTGPYEKMHIAYAAINEWLKKNNREPAGNLFEVYLNDPVSIKNPYELKTDIYQPIR